MRACRVRLRNVCLVHSYLNLAVPHSHVLRYLLSTLRGHPSLAPPLQRLRHVSRRQVLLGGLLAKDEPLIVD